jgi:YegS/Rv2252/BmrU family lipid kinase
MQRVKVILNPYAGRGRGEQLAAQIRSALTQAGLVFDLVETTGVGHGIDLARQARAEGYTTIVAAGGDGTVSEVINGMAQATPAGLPVGPLGILPVGSGNDFAEMAGCALELGAAAQAIAAGRTRAVDLGSVAIQSGSATIHRHFDNNLGIGFEAWVTLESYKIRWLRGAPLYTLAALRALRTCPDPYVDLTWESQNGERHRRSQRSLMISVGNSRRTGGGFFLTPDAQLDDGLLDVAIAADVSRLRILWLLPKALRGTHTGDAAITMMRCHQLSVEMAEPLPIHVDGEVVTRHASRVEVTLQPGRLVVLV